MNSCISRNLSFHLLPLSFTELFLISLSFYRLPTPRTVASVSPFVWSRIKYPVPKIYRYNLLTSFQIGQTSCYCYFWFEPGEWHEAIKWVRLIGRGGDNSAWPRFETPIKISSSLLSAIWVHAIGHLLKALNIWKTLSAQTRVLWFCRARFSK